MTRRRKRPRPISNRMKFLELIDRWFPPPEILRLNGLGVDISESSIKYIGFEPSYTGMTGLSLKHWGEVDLKAGILSGGEIKDVEGLAAAINEVRKKTGVSYMRLSLPEERVYIFETEFEADTDHSEIRNLVEFRLEENVPLSPRDAYFDYHISKDKSDGRLLASVTVCARELVDKYYEACRHARVTPLSFEVESQAIARAVLPEKDHGTKLLVDFGKTRTGLGIVHHSVLHYTSTIDIGGNELSVALKRQVGEKEESELTKIKNEEGLVQGVGNTISSEALLPIVSAIKDEVQTRMQYWNDKYTSSRPIEEIILCGGSVNLRGLPAYLTETLGVETVMGDVWQNAFDTKLFAPPIDRRHSYGYATAIGLGLGSFSDDI